MPEDSALYRWCKLIGINFTLRTAVMEREGVLVQLYSFIILDASWGVSGHRHAPVA